MNQVDLAFTPALEQAQLIRKGDISPLDLVQLYLERIEALNAQLGSYFTVASDMALADAKAKTEQLAETTDTSKLPPFFGVPIAIKDLRAVEGLPCSFGVAALKDNIANYDDGVITRIKQAGFIILGKTATSELGSLPYTEPPGFPPARNPWNLDYTPGGSSGGSAAAVAAGLSPIAQGSDAGGSLRGPAFCCGLVAIKPTRGRISYAPAGDFQSGIASLGPMARTVADAAALLDVMSGYITGDPYWLPDPDISFLEATDQQLDNLRISFATSIKPIAETSAVCEKIVLETVQRLEGMGHLVEPGCPDFSEILEPFKTVWQAGVASAGIPLEALSPMNRWIAEQSGTAGEYLQAVSKLQIIARQIVGFFNNFDVLVLPTYLHSPIRVGEWEDLSYQKTLNNIINWIGPCSPFNATGLPAIAIPAGFNENGLPVGIQLVGPPASEARLLALAAQLEAANPWIHHRPTL